MGKRLIDYDAKSKALSAARAVVEKNEQTLVALGDGWTDSYTSALRRLCVEATTQQWDWFKHAEVEGWPTKMFIIILNALVGDIRPRLVVRARLMSVLQEYR